MKNGEHAVIYVGKAKDLRKRLVSYTRPHDVKTQNLTEEIRTIEWVVTDTEVEALILEMQLIQQYHPKYNIDLQTPGRYAFIQRTDEEYPRFIVARSTKGKGKFFGPFPSGAARTAALRSIYDIFRLCKASRKSNKPCFRSYLGLCSGACTRKISTLEYGRAVRAAERFLRGNIHGLVRDIKSAMQQAGREQKFEKAKILRDQFLALQKIQEQHVSRPKQFDQDVVSYAVDGNVLVTQLFHFQRGIISGRKEYTFSLKKTFLEPREVFQKFLEQYYAAHAAPRELVVPEPLIEQNIFLAYLASASGHAVRVTVPQKGTKKKLLELVNKNLAAGHSARDGQLAGLQHALHLERMPQVIDCIDISTLGGIDNVGSLVHFVNGQPAKAGYRKFKIKGFEGMNDFAAVHEVVSRFAKRINEGKERAPDLLVIDGGRGQLSSAQKALSETGLSIPAIGLAKRLEEIYVSWAKIPLILSPRNSGLQLLRAIRDEAHRFAITFQRKRRRMVA